MTTYEIRVVDPRDEALLRAWWEVGEAATADRPIDAWTVWEVSRRALPVPRTDGRLVLLSAFDGDVTVGAGMLFLFRHDNTHLGRGRGLRPPRPPAPRRRPRAARRARAAGPGRRPDAS